MIYLSKLASDAELAKVSAEFKWFTYDEVKGLGDQLFPDCTMLLEQVLGADTIYQK
jgi:hypothetical protein